MADLGREVTQIPGFEWATGMVYTYLGFPRSLALSSGLAESWARIGPPESTSLHLDHLANVGPLARLLETLIDDDETSFFVDYGNRCVGIYSDGCEGAVSKRFDWTDEETPCHALARACLWIAGVEHG